jgi:anti-sigma regulatory factor (Ser/Thr protein kinase)
MELNPSGRPELRIGLQNQAENVALVRQALNGMAAAVQLDAPVLSDVKTAVSEACNNVVVHAYGGNVGPMEVYMAPDEHELEVVVSDRGGGIRPGTPASPNGMQGVGLSLIQALTKTVEFAGGDGQGTEVRMVFDAGEALKVGGAEAVQADSDAPGGPPPGDIELSVCGLLTGPVLSSVVAMVAARSGFSVERLSDAQILADTLAAHAPASFSGRHLHLAIDTGDKRLLLRLGPLVDNGASSLVSASAVGGLDPLIERLTDDLSVDSLDEGEALVMSLRDGL